MNEAARLADKHLGKRQVVEGSTRPDTDPKRLMKAAVWHGMKKVDIEEVPRPLITHPSDVIVKVTACTICSGSDGHMFAGEIPDVADGQILGHEGMGIVVEKGDNVEKLEIGDRVVIAFDIACGSCEYCLKKQFTACSQTNDSALCEKTHKGIHAAIFGYGDMLGGVPGSQAEYVRVPFADVNCLKIPPNIPDETALYISDVLCTSLHAVTMGEVKEGDTVAIWGLGPIGLLAARWAQIKGASRVIGIDLVPERLELAKKALGIDVIDRSNLDVSVPDAVLQIVPEGVDCSIEACGFRFATTLKHKVERGLGLETDTSDLLNECMLSTKKFGHVSVIGDYVGMTNHFAIGTLMFKHLTMRSGQCPCQLYFDEVLEHLQDGSMDPRFLVTNWITLEEIPKAYMKLFYKEVGWIKVFVRVGEEGTDLAQGNLEQQREGAFPLR